VATVVRLGPLPLGRRREHRLGELRRIFAADVELVEVFDIAAMAAAIGTHGVVALAVDATGPGELADALAAAGQLPVLRPLWREQRSSRGEIDRLFDGYGLLTATGITELADGSLSTR